MMFYLTGASISLAKSSEVPQNDVSKSLGGYISSSIVPNGSVNALFDMLSLSTLKNKPRETIAIALINKFDFAVANVTAKLVTKKSNICKYKIAAVSVGEDYVMEHIDNRYAEPIQAEFHDIDFHRASVEAEITNPAIDGEIISFQPFDVTVEVQESGLDETMKAIINAFSLSSDYMANKLSEKRFEIVSRSENVIDEPLECFAIATENAEVEFSDNFKNGKDNTALIAETLLPNQAIGFWIQREVQPEIITNEELIKRYDEKAVVEELEELELVIDYQAVEEHEPEELIENGEENDPEGD